FRYGSHAIPVSSKRWSSLNWADLSIPDDGPPCGGFSRTVEASDGEIRRGRKASYFERAIAFSVITLGGTFARARSGLSGTAGIHCTAKARSFRSSRTTLTRDNSVVNELSQPAVKRPTVKPVVKTRRDPIRSLAVIQTSCKLAARPVNPM